MLEHRSESSHNTSLQQMQSTLVRDAQVALATPSFTGRNERMASTVGNISASLAASSIGMPGIQTQLEGIFVQAATQAGEAFRPAFTDEGIPDEAQGSHYNDAMSAAGGVALKYIPAALEVARIEGIDPWRLLHDVTFDEVLAVSVEQLGIIESLPLFTADRVKTILHKLISPDSFFVSEIDDLPFSHDGQRRLSDPELKALDISVRLANATWMAGQVHRASWDGNDKRIDPQQSEAFNPYDLLKKSKYERYLTEGKTSEEALVRVAFEVWKDVLEPKKAANLEN